MTPFVAAAENEGRCHRQQEMTRWIWIYLLELRKWREERIFPLDRRSSLTEKEERRQG
jgi:hypothetical protein